MSQTLAYTPLEAITPAYDAVKRTFLAHTSRPVAWRKQQLRALGYMIQENEAAFNEALNKDLGRAAFETITAETNALKAEINEAIAHLDKWAKPQAVSTSLIWWGAKPSTVSQPKGVALIIGAYNFPLALLLGPAIGAIAAGCTAILKPAEQSQFSAAMIADLVPKYLDPEAFKVVNGGIAETTALLKLRWDHIFYTGSAQVGKVVARAAAEYLTSCTLELGGKSPAVVFDDADLVTSARRLLWGKFTNSGQICIAPDYVLCSKATQPKLVEAFKTAMKEFNPTGPLLENEQYSRIVSGRHFTRINKLLKDTKGTVVLGGESDEAKLKIEVTVVSDVLPDDSLMSEEIFGPILPIVTMETKEEFSQFINSNESPLALYSFTGNAENSRFLSETTRSGSVIQNDVLVHFLIPGLEFGGTGTSGSGTYHGKASFDAFSHARAHAAIPMLFEPVLASRYPPYTAGKLKLMMLASGAKITGARPTKM